MSNAPDAAFIEQQLAFEDFAVDFLARWQAWFPKRQAARYLLEQAAATGNTGLAEVASELAADVNNDMWLDTYPHTPRKRGQHLGQAQGTLCRTLLVLSILCHAGSRRGALSELLHKHDIDHERWKRWRVLVGKTEREEASRAALLPARYGIRTPVQESLWAQYMFQLRALSSREG